MPDMLQRSARHAHVVIDCIKCQLDVRELAFGVAPSRLAPAGEVNDAERSITAQRSRPWEPPGGLAVWRCLIAVLRTEIAQLAALVEHELRMNNVPGVRERRPC